MNLMHLPTRCKGIHTVTLKLSRSKPPLTLIPRHIKKHHMREQLDQRIAPAAHRPRKHPVIMRRKLTLERAQPVLNRSLHSERDIARCPVHIIRVKMLDAKRFSERTTERARPRSGSPQDMNTMCQGRYIIEKAPRQTQGFQSSILKQWGTQPLIPLTFTAV